MASEVFWRSGDARKVFRRSGEGAGVGGFGGSPHLKRRQTIERGLGMQWPVHCSFT